MTDAPRPRLVDHLRVAWLLVVTLLGLVPLLVWFILSPVLRPLVRARLGRRLAEGGELPRELPEPDPAAWAGRTVFVVAGEASGDRILAPVVKAMRAHCPGIKVRGYAGSRTAAAGAELDRDLIDHAVVGVSAVIRSLGFWWGVCAETLARLREDPPDLFLTVDFPGLNVRLARWARARGVPTVHLVAPAVWAYMPWRIVRWRRAVDRLLTVFPHEAVLFRGSGIPSTHVGHPSFEAPLAPPRTPDAWPGGGPCTVEVFPGSRRQEILHHAPIALDACARVARALPEARFVLRLADPAHLAVFDEATTDAPRPPHISSGASDLPLLGAIAKSGTITAELAAACVPLSVFYWLSWPMRFGALIGLTSPFFSLVNLIAGRRLAPERLLSTTDGSGVAADFLSVAGTSASWLGARAALEVEVRRRLEVAEVADRTACAVLQTPPSSSASARPVGESAQPSSPAGGPS